MPLEYFTLPLQLNKVMQKQELPRCSLQQSVIQHLHLLLTTGFGEFPADETFGCGIWDNDFDNVTSAHKVKEIIRQSLLQSIQNKEKRLANVRVELTMVQDEILEGKIVGRRIKKRIDITVTGTLQLTNERIQFRDKFYVGPLSY
jgi:phage baseplate assembly protein W